MVEPWLREMAEKCDVNVLAYSYSGYGRSTGTPSEANVYADVDAAWDYLVSERRCAPSSIIAYGRSIGSGAALYLAERLCEEGTPPAGVVLQSPVASVFRVACNFRCTPPCDMFPNVDRARNLRCPVFVIHGTRDEVVPLWHGQDLVLATPLRFRYEPFYVARGGHNNVEALLRPTGALFSKLAGFYRYTANTAATRSPPREAPRVLLKTAADDVEAPGSRRSSDDAPAVVPASASSSKPLLAEEATTAVGLVVDDGEDAPSGPRSERGSFALQARPVPSRAVAPLEDATSRLARTGHRRSYYAGPRQPAPGGGCAEEGAGAQ